MSQHSARRAAVLALAVALACSGSSGGEQAPHISSFTATPGSVGAGGASTLTWSVTGADTVSIAPDVGEVAGTSVEVTPGADTTYTLTATNAQGSDTAQATVTILPAGTVRVGYLHHSTGGVVWGGGVPGLVQGYDDLHGTSYTIEDVTYPDTGGGYPWANYPYDYWNLWVNHTGQSRDQGEQNLDDLSARYDVIVFKHCFPVSGIGADGATSSVSSQDMTIGNYELQYAALAARMHQFPSVKFLVWTGAALRAAETDADQAQRALQFFTWVKDTWDEPGDNVFVWDFRALEVAGSPGGLYLNDAFSAGDSHPTDAFARTVAPLFVNRLVDVIEGRGDTGSLTGQ